MGADGIFRKSTSPLSLMKTYRMSLISAGSISLGSTFKLQHMVCCNISHQQVCSLSSHLNSTTNKYGKTMLRAFTTESFLLHRSTKKNSSVMQALQNLPFRSNIVLKSEIYHTLNSMTLHSGAVTWW